MTDKIVSKMDGKEISHEEIERYKDEVNISGVIDTKRPTVNKPTMQIGHNDDGTIKEKIIEPQIYEIERHDEK